MTHLYLFIHIFWVNLRIWVHHSRSQLPGLSQADLCKLEHLANLVLYFTFVFKKSIWHPCVWNKVWLHSYTKASSIRISLIVVWFYVLNMCYFDKDKVPKLLSGFLSPVLEWINDLYFTDLLFPPLSSQTVSLLKQHFTRPK